LGAINPLARRRPWVVAGPGPSPSATATRIANLENAALVTLTHREKRMSLTNPPQQGHMPDSMVHDLITAILVATGAVIASNLLDRIWDTL
jgi:hypothetical protein